MSVNDIIFASLGTALFIGLIILVLIWLFIYTAVKVATKNAIKEAYKDIKLMPEIKHTTPEEELKKEMEGWN